MTQSEEFEAWFKRDFHPDKSGPYLKNMLLEAWQAAKAQAVPEGYRLMPPEPTPEMIEAWRESLFDLDPDENFASGYDAMFLAAPEQNK